MLGGRLSGGKDRNMIVATFMVCRNHAVELETRIKAALEEFYAVHRQPPASMVVHTSEVSDAQAAVRQLAPDTGVEVRGCGGCLVPEVWVELPNTKRNETDVYQQGRLIWEA